MTREEIPRLHTTHLLGQLRVLVLHIPREHLRLTIKMIQLGILPPRTLLPVAQRRHDKPIPVQSRHHPFTHCNRIDNVLALLQLHVVGVPAAGNAQFLSLGPAVWPEEGLPVLGDRKDCVGFAGKGLDEGGDRVEVGLDHFGAQGGEGLRGFGGRGPRQAADFPVGVGQEPAGDGAALVAGCADYDYEFLVVGHDVWCVVCLLLCVVETYKTCKS